MADQKLQNFDNHVRMVPGYHYFTLPLCTAWLVWAILRVVRFPNADNAFFLVGALALAGVCVYSRVFPLMAQDRVIRLEERLRLMRLLPAEMHHEIERISPRHLVSMRFASDEEVPELVRLVISQPSMKGAEIKKRIKSWRGDHLRV
jgi:hypothetical protein